MKRYALLTMPLLALACGTSPSTEATEETTQAVSTPYTAADGYTNLPSNTGRFCRLQSIGSRQGHIQSPTWPNTFHKGGSVIATMDGASGGNGTLTAHVYGTAAPPSRTASAAAVCTPYADLGFGGGASQSSPAENLMLSWSTSSGQNFVSGDVSLGWLNPGTFNGAGSFCYLNGFDSMTAPGEATKVLPTGDGTWHLTAQGYPRLAAMAKCVYPNRTFGIAGPIRATNSTVTGPASSNSICAFTMLAGNYDDGAAVIYASGGSWQLEVRSYASQTLIAEMTCAVFQ